MRNAIEQGATGDNAAIHTETPRTDQTADYRPTTLTLDRSFEVNRNDRYDVGQLLRFNDAEFIKAAYRAILKREPDEAGARYYLQSLRQGNFDKLHVILTLLSSAEGKQKNVRIDGLTAPLWLRRVTGLPVVGSWLRYAIDFLRAPILIRRLEQSSVIADTRNQQIASHVKQSNQDAAVALSSGLALLNARVSEVSDAANQLHTQTQQRLAVLKSEFAKSINESAAVTKAEVRDEMHRNADATRQELRALESAVSETTRATESKIEELLGEINNRMREIHEAREQLSETGRLTEQVAKEFTTLSTDSQRLRQEIGIQRARLALLEGRSSRAPLVGRELPESVAGSARNFDALYAELEDHFRGAGENLRRSFEFYLPYVQSLPQAELPVVDLGCGRGEWLGLLHEHNVKAIGVDNNSVMVESCRDSSLPVVESAALAYLREQSESSLRAVTAFHLIEHLQFEDLMSLLDEIMRTLQPGGVAIFETPNPDNLFVASNYFYHDPTHRQPLPSRLAKFLVESRGFARVEVINLHECAEGRFAGADEVSVRLNELFYGPMDYAIVGWKYDE
jgi:O-antigen chain-terminating methyltransferase